MNIVVELYLYFRVPVSAISAEVDMSLRSFSPTYYVSMDGFYYQCIIYSAN